MTALADVNRQLFIESLNDPENPSPLIEQSRQQFTQQLPEPTADVTAQREMLQQLSPYVAEFATPGQFNRNFALGVTNALIDLLPKSRQLRAAVGQFMPEEERIALEYLEFPLLGNVVQLFDEMEAAVPEERGAGGVAGRVVGATVPSAIAIMAPPLQPVVIAGFGQAAGLRNLEEGGNLVTAIGAGAIEAGAEYFGSIVLPTRIAGRVMSRLGTDILQGNYRAAARTMLGISGSGTVNGWEEVLTLFGTEFTNALASDMYGPAGSQEALETAWRNFKQQAPATFAAGFAGGAILFGPAALARRGDFQRQRIRANTETAKQLAPPSQQSAIDKSMEEQLKVQGDEVVESVEDFVGTLSPEEMPAARQVAQELAAQEGREAAQRQRAEEIVRATRDGPTAARAAEPASAALRAQVEALVTRAETQVTQEQQPPTPVFRQLRQQANKKIRAEVKALQDENRAIVSRVRRLAKQKEVDRKALSDEVKKLVPADEQSKFINRILAANTEGARGKVLQEAIQFKAKSDAKEARTRYRKALKAARGADVSPQVRDTINAIPELPEDASTEDLIEQSVILEQAVKTGAAERKAAEEGIKAARRQSADLVAGEIGRLKKVATQRAQRVGGILNLWRFTSAAKLGTLTRWLGGDRASETYQVIYHNQDVAADEATGKEREWQTTLEDSLSEFGMGPQEIATRSDVIGGSRASKTQEVEIGGKTLDMTRGDIMSFTAALRNPRIRRLASRSGILIRGARASTAVKPTEEELEAWANGAMATPLENRAIQAGLDLLNGPMKQDASQAFRRVLNEDLTTDETYYPSERRIVGRSREAANKEITDTTFLRRSALEASIAQETTEDISKPFVISDFFATMGDVIQRQAQWTSRTEAWLNANAVVRDPNVRTALEDIKGGANARRHIDTRMQQVAREILRQPRQLSWFDRVLQRGTRNVGVGILGGSINVPFYQPVSLIIAGLRMNPRYIMQAFPVTLAKVGRDDALDQEMYEQAPYIWKRSRGPGNLMVDETVEGTPDIFGQTGGIGKRIERFLMSGIRFMDRLAIRTIWRGAGMQAKAEGRDQAQLALIVVKETQPVWDTLNISGTGMEARESSGLRIFTMFRSQLGTQYDLLLDSFVNGNRRDSAKVITAILLSAIMVAEIRLLVAEFIRGKEVDKDRDLMLGSIDTVLGNFVGGNLISNAVKAAAFQERQFDPDFSPVLGIGTDVIRGAGALVDDIREGDIEDIMELLANVNTIMPVRQFPVGIGAFRAIRDLGKRAFEEEKSEPVPRL